MLSKLSIKNYTLIESLELEFPDHLVIITGETGAGKSILLGAVSLLMGGKAEASQLKDPSKNCVVEAIFQTADGEKILRRVIAPSMRSRFFIDDEPVSASEMEEAASLLLDIHAQHNHLLLYNKDFQLSVLDGYSSNASQLSSYKDEYEKVRELKSELSGVEKKIERAKEESAAREKELRMLQSASLQEGQTEALEKEQLQLENAQQIIESCSGATNLLEGGEGSVSQNIKEAIRLIEKSSNFAPELEELAERLESCRIECKDVASDIDRVLSSTSLSPERLATVEEKLSAIYSLLKRFNLTTESELIALRDKLEEESQSTEMLEELKEKLEAEIKEHTKERNALAAKLSKRRKEGAVSLENLLTKEIRSLEMPVAKFKAEVESTEDYTPSGADRVRFLFSANGDEKLVELQKVASGGELSRIMLCIKKVMAGYRGMPTLFFDEIDVGVSGSIADKVGQLLDAMGEKMQILAITHLPQVASKGKAHLLVTKELEKGGARSAFTFIKGKDRVMEIARLLSGQKTTPQAVANAKVLLQAAKS